jgi:hypothetical protein
MPIERLRLEEGDEISCNLFPSLNYAGAGRKPKGLSFLLDCYRENEAGVDESFGDFEALDIPTGRVRISTAEPLKASHLETLKNEERHLRVEVLADSECELWGGLRGEGYELSCRRPG